MSHDRVAGQAAAAAADATLAGIETALALVESRHVMHAFTDGAPTIERCARLLGWPSGEAVAGLAGNPVGRVQFGGEFCETLLPTAGQLAAVRDLVQALDVELSLVTPVMSDHGQRLLGELLPLLPSGSEVVANDWGTLNRLGRDHPGLRPVAGRLLCKMIKDPRLPSEAWARLYPHGVHSGPFGRILARFGVARVEMDVPPFATDHDFRSGGPAVAVHAPYGFSVKGRACKIGSLGLAADEKFATGHRCRKECLVYGASVSRGGDRPDDLATFQRGNTLFYRHSPDMAGAVRDAVARGWVDRIIVAGDWHEDRRADQ